MTRSLVPKFTTLTKFIFSEQSKFSQAADEMTELLNSLQIIAKVISAMVRGVGLTHLFGISDTKEPRKFQKAADEIFINFLTSTRTVGLMVSEERKSIIEVEKDHKGKYIICFDPLDGTSSNLDAGITVGSIFGVWTKGTQDLPSAEDALNPHNKMVAAGYMLYGSCTNFVFSTGHGVHSFVLDPQIGEFLSTHSNIKIPNRGSTYSINEGYANLWDEATKSYVMEKKFPTRGKPYAARYVGAMVADVHRTILHGGIFMYPSTKKAPHGKLKVLYECKPMAFLVTQAGGLASTGYDLILNIKPNNIHQATPIFLGSKEDVEEVMTKYRAK